MEIKAIRLSGGKREIVPANCTILNPEMEGKRPYAYFVWATPAQPEGFIDFISSATGRGLHAPFIYFTEHEDLFITGRNDTATLRPNLEDMIPDYLELQELAVKALMNDGMKQPFLLAYCMCDSNNVSLIGTSHEYSIGQ